MKNCIGFVVLLGMSGAGVSEACGEDRESEVAISCQVGLYLPISGPRRAKESTTLRIKMLTKEEEQPDSDVLPARVELAEEEIGKFRVETVYQYGRRYYGVIISDTKSGRTVARYDCPIDDAITALKGSWSIFHPVDGTELELNFSVERPEKRLKRRPLKVGTAED